MLAMIKTGIAVAAVTAGTVVPQVASTPSSDFVPPPPPGQDQDNGRFQGDFMDTVLEVLGVSRGDVISHVRTGGTLAELAEQNGSSGEELVDALVAVANEKIDAALDAGKIDEARAEELRAKAEERITTAVYSTHGGGNPGLGNKPFRGLILDTTMDFLDLNQGQVVSHVRTGGTLAELAEENGSSGPELEEALVSAVDARLQEAVANGDITTEQAEKLLERATERIGELVYEVHTPGRGK
jgi:hypothetical protein